MRNQPPNLLQILWSPNAVGVGKARIKNRTGGTALFTYKLLYRTDSGLPASGMPSLRSAQIELSLHINFSERLVMAVRLFVGNLPYDTTEADLREHFSPVGTIVYVYLPKDRETGKPRGFAFVEFDTRTEAEEAIKRFNNQPFKGRPMAINEARAKEDRPRSAVASRPMAPRNDWQNEPIIDLPPEGGGKPSRNFGPDAAPRRKGKQQRPQKSERVPKGPLRERRAGGILFDEDENDFENFEEDDNSGENFASRVDDDDDETDWGDRR